ncbi:XRE family transcriptional regulator [Streptomyces sp. NBC_01180]|uniref:XRE family transcriptional regulator n=1 Tax=Streptomyces sp. NBC_01180 TaxID=2903763 RepID=UPI0038673C87|nr:XRE family transcriptional regulator [Streptomyces sp. NBC_01180]
MTATSSHPSGDPADDPAERFASELRALRHSAGGPAYRQMSARTGQSSSALSAAAQGGQLPPLDVALAYAEACDGDRAEWERRWRAARAEVVMTPTSATAPAPPSTSPTAAPGRRWAVGAAVGAGVLVLAVVGGVLASRPGHKPPPSDVAAASRFFTGDDVFNQRHPRSHPAPESAELVDDLLTPGRAQLSTGTAGLPVYRATSTTPTFTVTPREHIGSWGPDPFKGVAFPWDTSWKAPKREWTVVITPDGRALECWRIKVQGGRPSCEWGAVSDTRRASGVRKGQATGSGLSRLAGMITRADWKAGRIDHALSFGAPDNNGQYVFPAVGSDGRRKGRWREGQFIWLDPAYDIDADTTLKPYERMVAKALQEYGAFDVKNADTFSFMSEYGSKPPGDSTGTYAPLTGIKFAKYLRVGMVSPAS